MLPFNSEVSWCNAAGVCQQTGFTWSSVQGCDPGGNTRSALFHLVPHCATFNVDVLLQGLALDEIKSHHWCIIGCSAVTGENLLAGVDWLLDDIAARIFTAE